MCLCVLGLFVCVEMMEAAFPGVKEKTVMQQGEWHLVRGLPDGEGEWMALGADTPDTGYLALQPQEDCTGENIWVRKMVGSYLPIEDSLRLRQDVVYGLCDMALQYPLDEGVCFTRGYLTPAEQDAWQADAVRRYERVNRAAAQAVLRVPGGGRSDHQSGLAVDVCLTGVMEMGRSEPLARNAAGRWLLDHMWEYGFVYDAAWEPCEDIHLRYVGRRHGGIMRLLNLSLSEYVHFLRQEKTVTLLRDGQPVACVQCVTEGKVWVPQGMEMECSRDDEGHWLVLTTVKGK